MRRRVAAPVPLFAALVLLLMAGPAGAGREIEYLYMDGSEGGGSGGHAALALGDRVFHFEHRAPGILRLAREPVDVIRHRYGVLYNRTILASHIPVSQDTYALVLDELTRRYFVQRQHLADYEAAVNDRRLLEAARNQRMGSSGTAAMVLDGAGLFFAIKAPDDSAFLFFTDNAPAARPVFGTLNVITGLGVAAAGLALLPLDRGELLTSGLKGAFFSLPELAFFNIRKGSFPDIERPAGPVAARDDQGR